MTTPSQFSYNNLVANSTVSGNVIDVSSVVSASVSVVCKGVNCNVYCKYKATRDATEWDFIDDPVLVYDSTPKNFSVAVKSKYMLITITTADAICDSLTCYTQYSSSLPNDSDVHISAESGDSVLVVNTAEAPLNVVGTVSINTASIAQEDTQQQILSNIYAFSNYIETSLTFTPDKSLWTAVENFPTSFGCSNVYLTNLSNIDCSLNSSFTDVNTYLDEIAGNVYILSSCVNNENKVKIAGDVSVSGSVSVDNLPTNYSNVALQQKQLSNLSILADCVSTGRVKTDTTGSITVSSGTVSANCTQIGSWSTNTLAGDGTSIGHHTNSLDVYTTNLPTNYSNVALQQDILSNLQTLSNKFSTSSGGNEVFVSAKINNNPFVYIAKRNGNDQQLLADTAGYLYTNANITNTNLAISNVALDTNLSVLNSNIATINTNLNDNLNTTIVNSNVSVDVKNAILPVSNVGFANLSNIDLPVSQINSNIILCNSNLSEINSNLSSVITASNVNTRVYGSTNGTDWHHLHVNASGNIIANSNTLDGAGVGITSHAVNSSQGLDTYILNTVATTNSNLDTSLSGVSNSINSNISLGNSNLSILSGGVSANKYQCNITNTSLATTQSGTWNMRIQDSAGGSLNATTNALNVYNTNNITGFATSANQLLTNSNLSLISGCVSASNLNVALPRTLTCNYGSVSFTITSAISGANFSNYFIDTTTFTMTPTFLAPTPTVVGSLSYIPKGANVIIALTHASAGSSNNILVPAACDSTTLANAYAIGAPSTQSSAFQITQCGSWSYRGVPRYIGFYNDSSSGSIASVKVIISFTY